MAIVIPKTNRAGPTTIETLSLRENLYPYMAGVNAKIEANALLGVSREQTFVDYALANSPYDRNGHSGVVTVAEDNRVTQGVHNYRCTRWNICPVQSRIPKNAPVGECPAIIFGEHKHQLYDNNAYNPQTGLLLELERLLDIVLQLQQFGIQPANLFFKGSEFYSAVQTNLIVLQLLCDFAIFEAVHTEFTESIYYETENAKDDKGKNDPCKSVAYVYFRQGIESTNAIQDKLFGVVYGGMRSTGLGERLQTTRKSLKQCAEFLVACGSLQFNGCEIVSQVSKQTASNVEQLILANFLAPTNERPNAQLKNYVLVTGDDYQIFTESVKEQRLSAFLLLKGISYNPNGLDLKRKNDEQPKAPISNWFTVNLHPKTQCGVNAPIDQMALNVIQYYARLLQSGDNWQENTIDAVQTAMQNQLAERDERIRKLEAQINAVHTN